MANLIFSEKKNIYIYILFNTYFRKSSAVILNDNLMAKDWTVRTKLFIELGEVFKRLHIPQK